MTKVISKKSSKSCERGKKIWWVAYNKIKRVYSQKMHTICSILAQIRKKHLMCSILSEQTLINTNKPLEIIATYLHMQYKCSGSGVTKANLLNHQSSFCYLVVYINVLNIQNTFATACLLQWTIKLQHIISTYLCMRTYDLETRFLPISYKNALKITYVYLLYNVILRIARNFLETRENSKISTHPVYHTNLD